MRIRDDLELSVLAESGDLASAEAVGFAWQTIYEAICAITGIPAEAMDRLDDVLDGLGGDFA